MCKITWPLLVKGPVEAYLQNLTGIFSVHLADKIILFWSHLYAKHSKVLWRCLGENLPNYLETAWSCWTWSGQSPWDCKHTCGLDSCPSWLTKVAREVSPGLIQAMVNSTLMEEIFFCSFKRDIGVPSFQEAIAEPYCCRQFLSSLLLPLFREGSWDSGKTTTPEDHEWNRLFGPFWSGTKTALVILLDDLWQELNGDNASILVFLDLLMAFDTLGPTWEVGGWWHNSVLIHLFPLRSVLNWYW